MLYEKSQLLPANTSKSQESQSRALCKCSTINMFQKDFFLWILYSTTDLYPLFFWKQNFEINITIEMKNSLNTKLYSNWIWKVLKPQHSLTE